MTDAALFAPSAPAATARVCAHCGELLRGGGDATFCCAGCASAHAIIEFRITWASNCEVTPFLSDPRGATRSRPHGYEANDDVRLSPFRSASVHSNV